MTVEEIIDDVIAEVVADVDSSAMLRYFKSALRRIPANIRSRMFLAEDTLTLAANSYTLDLTELSPSFSKERAIWYVDSNGRRIPITNPPSPDFFHRNFNPSGYGKPVYFRIYKRTLNFDKRSDESLTIGFDYFKKVSEIETDDEIEDESLIEGAKEYCKMAYFRDYEEDLNKAAEHERIGKEIILGIQSDYEEDESGNRVEETENY